MLRFYKLVQEIQLSDRCSQLLFLMNLLKVTKTRALNSLLYMTLKALHFYLCEKSFRYRKKIISKIKIFIDLCY